MAKTYIADKETQDAIKADTTEIKASASGIKTDTATIKENTEAIKTGTEAIRESASEIKTDTTTIKSDTTKILDALHSERPKRYGFRVKENESNPSTRVEYLFDAVGMTPVRMDYEGKTFNYGSWADFWVVRDNFPCMVKNSGTVDYQLNPNDYTLRATTGAASDVSNIAYAGNAMSAIPLVWVKRYHEDGYRYVIFCESQYDEGYKAYAHTRPDGTISPYAYGAMFEGSVQSGVLRSLSGLRPGNSINANAELAAAQKNGAAWTIETWAFWNLIHDLLILLGKSTNIQAVFGQGHTTGGQSADDLLTTGSLINKGQFFGSNDTVSSVKVFHMENFWGDRWDRLIGMIYENGMYKVKMTPEGGGYNFTGNGYATIRKGITDTEAGGGWVKNAQQTEYGLFPTVLAGSDATYDCDYHYYSPTVVSVPLVGGACVDGSQCGRYLNVNDTAGNAWWHFGASLFLNNPS